jgi:hypothetical protein
MRPFTLNIGFLMGKRGPLSLSLYIPKNTYKLDTSTCPYVAVFMKSPSISRVVLLGIIINDKLLNGIAYITLLCKTFKQAKRVLIFLQTVKNSQPDL